MIVTSIINIILCSKMKKLFYLSSWSRNIQFNVVQFKLMNFLFFFFFFLFLVGIEKQKYVDTRKMFIHCQRNIFGNENKKDTLVCKNTG